MGALRPASEFLDFRLPVRLNAYERAMSECDNGVIATAILILPHGARATSREGEWHLGAPGRTRMRWDGVETSHDVGTGLLSAVRMHLPSASTMPLQRPTTDTNVAQG